MALVTGSGLQNPSDVIDTVRTALINQGWTSVINDGTVVSNDKEVWLNIPAAQTKNGIEMTLGLRANGADIVEVLMTYLTPTEALLTPPGSPSAGRNAWNRVLGTPNINFSTNGRPGNSGDVYPDGSTSSSVFNSPVRTDGFNQGANYLNHWVFTPNQASPLSQTEQYFICVVEVATGVYRTFGAGEGIKLGGSGWEGGLWLCGSDIHTTTARLTSWFAAGDFEYSSFTDQGARSYVLNFNNPSYQQSSPVRWNPWLPMSQPWTTGWTAAAGMGPRRLGEDFMERAPANFSGQAIRVPSRFYAMNVRDGAGNNRMRPLLEIPDVFHMNISAVTPGEVITDDTEKFLVVPYVSKTGSNNSGNFGFLVRHPDL